MEELAKGKSELQIMTTFLTHERKRQKALGRLEGSLPAGEIPAKTEDQ